MGNSFALVIPSGSTNNRPVRVVATASPGTLVHNATSSPVDFDEVTLDLYNTTAVALEVTIEFGGTTASDQLVLVVPAKSLMRAVDQGRLNNGAVIRAFCPTAGVNLVAKVTRVQVS
ncbi:hypothetical protein [Candidatus Cyanaurora vandensis]|uniref:hypothetical protein n=1 Tax=Candidatus Cyanaurora vandensis TaxID=2714958 RepID=UPI00257F0306|nr:hypothetical protein [Candidatus Cyanaurora vandensis]